MTFDEFLEKCRKNDGWRYTFFPVSGKGRRIRNSEGQCPLQAVSDDGLGYAEWGRAEGLAVWRIIDAADGYTNGKYRKALETLVKS